MMNVNYEYYRTFYYVARYGNFTKAANVLNASQPNVTRSISNLEKQLGCTLFIRSNRGVTLTPEGERLFAHIEIVQEQIQQAENELSGNVGLKSGSVSIACSETALNIYLMERLQVFHERFPGIQIRISNHSTPQAVTSLENGLADFAVVTTPVLLNKNKQLKTKKLISFQEILVGSTKAIGRIKPGLSLHDLEQYSFVMLGRETMTYSFYNDLFSKNGIVMRPNIEVATTEQLLPMIRADLGIGFMPEPMTREAINKKEIFSIPLKEKIPEREVVLIWDLRRPMSVASKKLMELLMR